MNEATQLRKYISYIPLRLAYLKIYKVSPNHNEYKYYTELYKSIKEYGNSHKAFFLYLTRKINVEKCKAFYKVSERTFYRIFAKQRKEFIEWLRQKETELSKLYPFESDLDLKELQG